MSFAERASRSRGTASLIAAAVLAKVVVATIVLVAAVLAACGDPSPSPIDAARTDGGPPRDGGPLRDGETAPDASAPIDAARDPDATTSGPDGGPPTDCATARCYFVRDGASGDGSDWSRALDVLPDELERGAIYFVADGTYPSYGFDDEVDGTLRITVQKATAADHGTEVGWDPSYGDGAAELGPVTFHRSHYVLDGRVGGGRGSWRSGHGFRIVLPDGGFAITIGNPWGGPEERDLDRRDITVRHVEVHGPVPARACSDVGGGGVHVGSGLDGHEDVVLSHLWMHDLAIGIIGAVLRRAVLEESVIERNASTAECHSEGWAAWGPSEDVIVRNNIWSDIVGTAVIALGVADRWDVYGNVFMCAPDHPYDCGVGNGIIGMTDHPTEQSHDWNVHHNVFLNLTGGYSGGIDLISESAGIAERNTAHNNIFYAIDVGVGFAGVAHDDNWFFGTPDDEGLVASEPNGELGTGDPFVDWRNDDFRLAAPTRAGRSLPAPFDVDPDGVPRGADGTWDRGIYEHR
jgi:hypothetical protein